MAEFTRLEQVQFARYLRVRLPLQEGAVEIHIHAITAYCARVLKRPRLAHWRGITREEAQQVLQAAKAEFPVGRAT